MDISRYAGQKSRLICEGWFVRGSLTHLPFKDKAFQCLFCEGALEHVPEELIPQVFKEFQRVSEIRILAISFNAPTDKHHLCNHSVDWWFQRIPPNTWLFGAEGTQTKGWWFIKTIGNNGEENVFARIL
jgi:ubiquinone/menaquinone biosynthesis C-methylase UbiE